MSAEEIPPFDFADHAQKATALYLTKQAFYGDFSSVVSRIIEECLQQRDIKVQTVQHRAKSAKSFSDKSSTPSDDNPNEPKYRYPMKEITDLAGIRIITYFLDTIRHIDALISEEFDIVERSDKGETLLEQERFGYHSIHYLVRMKNDRACFGEYNRFAGSIAEIQVRTVLQHAWAEIEHDIQYKASSIIPTEIRRRFMALAGMLEIADREFQAIENSNKELEIHTQEMVQKGDIAGLEITPNSLKLFLDRKLCQDGRISDWTYNWEAKLLHQLGFRDLAQIEKAISGYDDRNLSNIIYGNRQGQTTRFELMLLAAMGEVFIQRHSLSNHDWFRLRQNNNLRKLREANISIGNYDPDEDTIFRGEMVAGWPERIRQAQMQRSISINGRLLPRIVYGAERNDYGADHQPCHDCGVLKGQWHVAGCDVEECPNCHEQLFICDCPNKVSAP